MKAVILENLTKKFGNFTAVDSVSLEVNKGEIFGFLGANGAGKTTVVKMLSGLIKPTSGNAKIAGFDIYRETEKIKKGIGYMSQKFSLYEDLTVKENIYFYGGVYGLSINELKEKTKVLLETLKLEKSDDVLIKSLPLGWKQKLAFSVAIIHEPQIVFLDEPTSGVDPVTRRQFWEMIYSASSRKITVFVTTHYLDEAEYCGRLSVMANGKIVAIGHPKELKSQYNSESFQDVFLKIAGYSV